MKKWARGLSYVRRRQYYPSGRRAWRMAAEGEINVNGTGVVQADPDTADISLETAQTAKQRRRHRRKTTALPRQ